MNVDKPKLIHSWLSLYGVDGSPLTVLGKTKLLVKFVDEEQHVDIILLKDENVAILGMNEMAKMKITINTADALCLCIMINLKALWVLM